VGPTDGVEIEVLVNADGRVSHALVARSRPHNDQACIQTVFMFVFRPAQRSGIPVTGRAVLLCRPKGRAAQQAHEADKARVSWW